MKRAVYCIVCVALIALALPAAAADVTGKWNCDVQLDMGGGEIVFEFKQEGEALTGTYSGMAGEIDLTGTVKGDEIEFQFETEFGTIVYKGKIESAGSMSGTADYAGQAGGTWTAKRAE